MRYVFLCSRVFALPIIFQPVRMEKRQKIVKSLAVQHDAIFVPLQNEFDCACQKAVDTYWLYDGVHPTAAGHMLIAKKWMQVVGEKTNDC